jgi:integrase
MNQHSAFVVSEFTNPSGEVVFRVSGRIAGKRIRTNFRTRSEAEVERQVLDVRRLQAEGSPIRTAITRLTDEQLREAELAFGQLQGFKNSLSFYLAFALANYREPASAMKLGDAIAHYVAAKKHEHDQDLLSISQYSRIKRDLARFQKLHVGTTVAELTSDRLIGYFELGRPSQKTYNNRRGIVSTFLKYCFYKSWIAENPLARIPALRIRRRRGTAETLTAKQAREMMQFLESFEKGRWVPFFALALFAGVRPAVPHGEITRLRPRDVDLDTGIITISAHVSKVREPRKTIIQPNLAAWLKAYPLNRFPLVLPDFQRRRAALSKRLGLSHDVLRHTFISMFVAKFRSIGEAAIQAGNSESIIRRHYLDLKTTAEAEEFWSILPKSRTVAANPPHAKPQPAEGPAQIIQHETAA